MEDILVAKIIEAEDKADKIVSDSKVTAKNLIDEHTLKFNLEKKEIEKKYDDLLISGQEKIKKEFDAEYEIKLKEMKKDAEKLKDHSKNSAHFYGRMIHFIHLYGVFLFLSFFISLLLFYHDLLLSETWDIRVSTYVG